MHDQVDGPAGAFFVPAVIGVQEGAFVIALEVLTGRPPLGRATGLVKRAPETAWIALGLLVGWMDSFKPSLREHESAREPR